MCIYMETFKLLRVLVRIFKFVQPYDGGVCKQATIYTTNDCYVLSSSVKLGAQPFLVLGLNNFKWA